MGDIIKPHSFEDAKQHIQTFSSKTSPDLGLDKVQSNGGLFGWFDHNVTGAELNKITTQVQEYLIKFNGLHTEFIGEFGQVYKALESLDKEYIPAILGAVKGAETASNQAKAAQDDIKKSIEAQKKIITVLEEHKAKLDKLKHLANIDEIWKASKDLEKDIKSFKESFESTKKQVSRLEESIKAVQRYADSLLDYEHLEDIDDIWERVGQSENSIDGLLTQVEDLDAGIQSIERTLDNLQRSIDELNSYEHISDVDSMWNDIETAKGNISQLNDSTSSLKTGLENVESVTTELKGFKSEIEKQEHLFQIDDLWKLASDEQERIGSVEKTISEKTTILDNVSSRLNDVESYVETHGKEIALLGDSSSQSAAQIEDLIKQLDEEKQNHITNIEMMKKKVLIAYTIAGGAIALGVMNLVLSLLGIL